jgi:hypothetical protein
MSQLADYQMPPFCHSGLDPLFDRPFDRLTVLSRVEGLTTLSKVERESSAISSYYISGCRIKSGMTSSR